MKKKSFYVAVLCVMCFIMSLGLSVPAVAASKPARPKLISAKQTAPRTITIRWKKAKNARQYDLYVSENGSGFEKLVRQKGRSYTHTGVTPGSTYLYRVRAVNGKKKSGFSNTRSVTITKTTADYYDDLKQIIQHSTKVTKAGDHAIVGTISAPTYFCEYSIIYKQNYDTFSYFMNMQGSNFTAYVELFVNSNAITTGKAKAEFDVLYNTGATIQMYTYVDMASYHKNQYLSWQGSGAENLANETLSLSFLTWDDLLKKQTNLTLKDLGFTSFVA